MALRIFDTDPDARPKPRQSFNDEYAARFYMGRQVDNQPEALSEWRVMTADREVGQAIAQLVGGRPVETDSSADKFIEILTTSARILVVLDGPGAITSDMKLWNRGKLVHHCDGVDFLSHADEKRVGTACGCPTLFAERKQAARDYMGPAPSINVRFRLADDPDLGQCHFQTTSWTLAEVLHEHDEALTRIGGEALCELSIEAVEYTTKKGRNVSYLKPVLRVLKSWNDAIAD
ncbi:recombination directionality factor [Streptomyces noursei]|uniref:recombination directionality factor n=1 Tax=Streptomyces noursei TaxID=1971 RepID=UPI0038119CD6